MKTKCKSMLAYARPWGSGFLPMVGSKVISNEVTAKYVLGRLLQAKRHQLPIVRIEFGRRYR